MLFKLFNNKKPISPKQVKENLDRDRNIVLIDVREKEEYNIGHIPGSYNIPFSNFDLLISTARISKDDVIYVYCQSGMRSKQACSKLKDLGFTNATNIGGLNKWPYPLVK